MSQLIFLANAGGNITLTGVNTPSIFSITVPAANGTLVLSDASNNVNVTNIVASGTLSITGASSFNTLSTTGDAIFGGTGEIQIPSGTTAQRSASPAQGMVRFNNSYNQYEGYFGSSWGLLGGGATGAGGDQIFVQNGKTVNNSYSIPSNQNASSTGPITIATGAVVTVPTGSRWVVL